MEKQNVIFFDIDGTIIDGMGHIPDSAVEAIHKAQSLKNLCVVNTGRPYSHIDPKVKGIGFDGYVCSCGQHIVLNDQVVLHVEFEKDLCREIVALTRECRLDVVYEAETGIWFDLSHEPIEPIKATYNQFEQRGFDVNRSVDKPDFCFDKLCVFVRPDSDVQPFLQFVEQYCTVIYREGDMLEIIRRGYSKESGLKTMLRLLNVPLECSYAIGDSTNDLPMLSSVAHSIAMGNAPEEVKAVVEYVTDPLEEHGLANALGRYGLC